MKILEVSLGDNVYAEVAMSPSYWQHLSITLDLGYKVTLYPESFKISHKSWLILSCWGDGLVGEMRT